MSIYTSVSYISYIGISRCRIEINICVLIVWDFYVFDRYNYLQILFSSLLLMASSRSQGLFVAAKTITFFLASVSSWASLAEAELAEDTPSI